jgi:hypothetical protein
MLSKTEALIAARIVLSTIAPAWAATIRHHPRVRGVQCRSSIHLDHYYLNLH